MMVTLIFIGIPLKVMSITFFADYKADYCGFTTTIDVYTPSLSQSIVSWSIPHYPSPFCPYWTTPSQLFHSQATSISVDITSPVYYRVQITTLVVTSIS
jgi:hypothetical protein